MVPSQAPVSPPGREAGVAEPGPPEIPRARPRCEPADPDTLTLRFADERRPRLPEVELPPGRITLLEGAGGTEPVRHRLVLDAARAGRATVHVVGGERLDTTGLARRAQARGLDPGSVLRASVLARAFTAYQLSALLEERLPRALDAEDAAAGLVIDPLRLYTDEDVRAAEARRLARGALDRLAEVARAHAVPLVVVQPARRSRPELTRMLREAASEHVLVRAAPDSGAAQSRRARPAHTVHLPGEGTTHRVQDPRPRQARLDRYRAASSPSGGETRG